MATKTIPTIDAIADECIAVRVRMLSRVVTSIYDEALRPLDLKVSQVSILIAVAKMDVARPAVVCDRLQLDVSTLSRSVERMKARGWLEAVSDEDRRAQPFQLTAKGKRLLKQAIPKWQVAQEKAKRILGDDGVAALNEAISRAAS